MNDAQQLIRDEEGQPVEVVGSWSDITERKRAEEAALKEIREARTRLTEAIESISEGFHFTTPKTGSSYTIAVIKSSLHPTLTCWCPVLASKQFYALLPSAA